MPKRHAIIIGGGASGALLAYQLLRRSNSAFRVTLIEQRPEIGRGLAYHTGNPDHLLNVRAANMSALPQDPDHFWRWLAARDASRCGDRYCFVPRRIYGDYIASLVKPLLSRGDDADGLRILNSQCISISENANGVLVELANGAELAGDVAVLATGHDSPKMPSACYADPWGLRSNAQIRKDSAVLILGTGLTMVDYALSLLRDGHSGPVVALSRRGLLPKAHRRVPPLRLDETEVPFGASVSQLLRWIRDRVDAHNAQGGNWRSVVDGIRPFTQRLWRELDVDSRRRFLEHARAWWDVHRHRMAPEVEAMVTRAIADHRLTILAGKLVGVSPNATGAKVRYRRRAQTTIESFNVGAIVDCTGIARNPHATGNPVVRSLFEQGLARVDPLHIGLEVAPDCAIINRAGLPSRRLFAIGPLTRAAFWEIIAIPDIRDQCVELAARIVQNAARMSGPSSMAASPATVPADAPMKKSRLIGHH
ncbi:FAD/NAD(P)-binding protein [Bradyrhizobium sp. STM 3562]|uniref:FAD/NAD(P)-binding protein n=1 Tax=Bradyrhizobium sp. STM 3562 TaxID=578924 RepID=UPI00388E7F16